MSSNLKASRSEMNEATEEVPLENSRSATGYLADTESSGSFPNCPRCGIKTRSLKRKLQLTTTRPPKRRRTMSPTTFRSPTNLQAQLRRRQRQKRRIIMPKVTATTITFSSHRKSHSETDTDCDSPLEESLPDIRMGGTNGLIFRIFNPSHEKCLKNSFINF